MKVLVAGDFYPRGRVSSMMELADYSFFDDVRFFTSETDYSIINLESPVVIKSANPILKTGPNLKCHENAMKAVKYAGFRCVTLANNHFYDYGDEGVVDTLESCAKNGIAYVGGGLNIEEAVKILYKDIKGERLAIVNYCENEWSIADETHGGSAPLDLVKNYYSIREARQNADYVLVIIHGGTEQYQLPTPRMKSTYRFFADLDVDAIVNHHQHCYSGYEIYKGVPIFYGLGNFCFDKNDTSDKLWNEGYAITLSFDKNKGTDFDIHPYCQCGDAASVVFLEDRSAFEEKLGELNAIIADDKMLEDSFEKMALSKKGFMMTFEPYKNKYLKILRSKGWLPSSINQEKKNLILELFRCEAHRDVMFKLLKE